MIAKKQTAQNNQIYISQRLNSLEQKLLCNWSRAELVEWYEDTYKLSYSQCDKDIKKVKGFWLKQFEAERESRLYEHCRKLEHLYRKAYKENELRTCLEVRKFLCELDGSFSPKTDSESEQVSKLLAIIAGLQSERDTVQCIE